MTTCSNKSERTLKKSEQAIEIIVDVVSQVRKINPFLKNIDLEALKVILRLRHQDHYPKNKSPYVLRSDAKVLLLKWKIDDLNSGNLINHLDQLFSLDSKHDKTMKKVSLLQKILSIILALFTIISLILAFTKTYLSVLTLQQNLSLFLEGNKRK